MRRGGTTAWPTPAGITAEPGSRIIRGLAVPFNEPAFVFQPSESGEELVAEYFDELSVPISNLPIGAPLLQSHDSAKPIGVVTDAHIDPAEGITFEAKLSVSEPELDALHARFADGLLTGVSVGFTAPATGQVRERARHPGHPPTLVRRHVSIRELSLVLWPAYMTAGIRSLMTREAIEAAVKTRVSVIRSRVDADTFVMLVRYAQNRHGIPAVSAEYLVQAAWQRIGSAPTRADVDSAFRRDEMRELKREAERTAEEMLQRRARGARP